MAITHWFEGGDPNFGDDSNSTTAQRAASVANLPNTYRVATDNKATAYGWLRRLNNVVSEGGTVEKFTCKRELRKGSVWFAFEFTLVEGKIFFLPH